MEMLVGDTVGLEVCEHSVFIHTRIDKSKSFMWGAIEKRIASIQGIKNTVFTKYDGYVEPAKLYSKEEILPEIRRIVVRLAPRS